LLLGFVLGDSLEANFRRVLILNDGDWTTFVTSPVAATLLVAALAMMLAVLFPKVRKGRSEVLSEE
jgi:TctA family transporter